MMNDKNLKFGILQHIKINLSTFCRDFAVLNFSYFTAKNPCRISSGTSQGSRAVRLGIHPPWVRGLGKDSWNEHGTFYGLFKHSILLDGWFMSLHSKYIYIYIFMLLIYSYTYIHICICIIYIYDYMYIHAAVCVYIYVYMLHICM